MLRERARTARAHARTLNKPLCSTLLDDHTWQIVRRVANIMCHGGMGIPFGVCCRQCSWSSGVYIYTPALKCGHKCFFCFLFCNCMCMHVPAMPLWVRAVR